MQGSGRVVPCVEPPLIERSHVKTRYVVLTLGALAALVFVVSGRAAPRETASADDDSGLVTMTEPPTRATSVVEPRVTGVATPERTARTTPTKRTSVSASAARAAARAKAATAAPPSAPPSAPPPETPAARTPVITVSRAATTPARVAAPGRLTLQPGSRLSFDGKSSVKDFTCKASTIEATVLTSTPDAASAIVAAEKSVTSVELRVPVAALDCDNGTMNGHMRNALDAKENPVIDFALRSYELADAAEGVTVTLTGTLTIRGEARPITFAAEATSAAGALRLVGVYELNMKDYGVKPPSLMLGTMKVREKVQVRFDLSLKD